MNSLVDLAVAAFVRRLESASASKRRLFPPGSICRRCDMVDPLVLQIYRGVIYCANHAAALRGWPVWVRHHLYDRRMPFVERVSRNVHELYNALERWRGPSFAPDPICGLPRGHVERLAVLKYVSKHWPREERVI